MSRKSRKLIFIIFFIFQGLCLVLGQSKANHRNHNSYKFDFPDTIFVDNKMVLDKQQISWLSPQTSNILLRFNDLDLPIEANKIHIKFSFQLQKNTTCFTKNPNVKVSYINPINGSKYSKDLKLNLNKEIKDFKLLGEDYIDADFFSEKGDILVLIEMCQKEYTIGITEDSILIVGLDSVGFDKYVGNSGIIFPTAETAKQSILNWNTFLYEKEKNKLGLNLSTLFLPRKATKDETSKLFMILDFKYCLLAETKKIPSLALGIISTEGIINTSELKEKNTYTGYFAVTKNLTKIINCNIGYMHGDLFNIFVNDSKTIVLENSDFLFCDILLRLSPSRALKFETGYDFSNTVEIYLLAYSFSVLKNYVSFDIGTSVCSLETEKNNDFFMICRLRI